MLVLLRCIKIIWEQNQWAGSVSQWELGSRVNTFVAHLGISRSRKETASGQLMSGLIQQRTGLGPLLVVNTSALSNQWSVTGREKTWRKVGSKPLAYLSTRSIKICRKPQKRWDATIDFDHSSTILASFWGVSGNINIFTTHSDGTLCRE